MTQAPPREQNALSLHVRHLEVHIRTQNLKLIQDQDDSANPRFLVGEISSTPLRQSKNIFSSDSGLLLPWRTTEERHSITHPSSYRGIYVSRLMDPVISKPELIAGGNIYSLAYLTHFGALGAFSPGHYTRNGSQGLGHTAGCSGMNRVPGSSSLWIDNHGIMMTYQIVTARWVRLKPKRGHFTQICFEAHLSDFQNLSR